MNPINIYSGTNLPVPKNKRDSSETIISTSNLLLSLISFKEMLKDKITMSCLAKTSTGEFENCTFPFNKDGKWIFGCIRGDYEGTNWCPTKLDANRRFRAGSSSWGFCDANCSNDTQGKIT
jgi:hypothetical protein